MQLYQPISSMMTVAVISSRWRTLLRTLLRTLTWWLTCWRSLHLMVVAQLFLPTSAHADELPVMPGRVLESTEILALERYVFPDGQGLPEGEGDVASGSTLYRSIVPLATAVVGRGAAL